MEGGPAGSKHVLRGGASEMELEPGQQRGNATKTNERVDRDLPSASLAVPYTLEWNILCEVWYDGGKATVTKGRAWARLSHRRNRQVVT